MTLSRFCVTLASWVECPEVARGGCSSFYEKDSYSEGWAVLSTPFRLELPRALHEAMIDQARAELPNECCGLLAGVIEEGVARVVRRFPLINAVASPVE